MELDGQTLELLQSIVAEKNIHTLWFEAHWIYRHKLAAFAALFPGVQVKFRCGVETFDPVLRKRWNKGIPENVAAADIAGYFKGVCLLCGTDVEDFNHIAADIETACKNFEYLSVNLFCNNTTGVKRSEEIARRFVDEIYPLYKENPKIEILIENNDLGVGSK